MNLTLIIVGVYLYGWNELQPKKIEIDLQLCTLKYKMYVVYLTLETCFFLSFGSCLTQFITDEKTFSSQSTFNRVEDISSST